MSLFTRKSDSVLKRDIKKYDRLEKGERRTEALENKRKALVSRYREAKYRKPLAFARGFSSGLKSVGSGVVKVGGAVSSNLSKYEVSPAFKANYSSDSMVSFPSVGKKGRGGLGLL